MFPYHLLTIKSSAPYSTHGKTVGLLRKYLLLPVTLKAGERVACWQSRLYIYTVSCSVTTSALLGLELRATPNQKDRRDFQKQLLSALTLGGWLCVSGTAVCPNADPWDCEKKGWLDGYVIEVQRWYNPETGHCKHRNQFLSGWNSSGLKEIKSCLTWQLLESLVYVTGLHC